MHNSKIEILQRALKREKEARKEAEKILENKSLELFEATLQLKNVNNTLNILLEDKTNQLQGVFANINDAYIVARLDGTIISANNKAIILLEYQFNNEQVYLSDIINSDIINPANVYSELNNNGVFNAYEIKIITKNNNIKWVHINANLVYNHSTDQSVVIQYFIKDITDSKLTAAIIKDQKQELEIIVEKSSLGIILTRFGKILKSNNAIQNILNYRESELYQKSLDNICIIDQITSKNLIDTSKKREIVQYRKKDGTIIWAKTNTNTVSFIDNKPKDQVIIIEDITLEREKTILLELMNNIAKSILGKMDLKTIAWEITHQIGKYLNSQDCVIYIVNQETKRVEQLSALGDKISSDKTIKNKLSTTFGQGIVGTVAKTGIGEIIKDTTKDKRYIIDDKHRLSEITVPILYNNQVIAVIDSEHSLKNHYTEQHLEALENIASLVSIQLNSALNLRERKKAEEKTQQLLAELSLSNTQLQEYAHIVSHDLKSPLRSIQALSSWIKEDNINNLDETSLTNFTLIDITLEKMEHLISGILTYSSIENINDRIEIVDINELITDVQNLIYIPDHFEINIIKKLPKLRGERLKFQQIFQNLISNAIKYNDKVKGVIEIDVEDTEQYYQFSIKDNGIGIESKYFQKIFEIFNSLSTKESSTGIGLSIVKKIINIYKGEIWVKSILNKETTFYFTIKK